jgi:ubiquinone/menaquinone biosynthesis C-methylase UbiE
LALADGSHAHGGVGYFMIWWHIGLVVAGVLALAALAYWQLIVAEGTYLGPRVVAKTYDWVAFRYDAIKQFDPRDESWFVSEPVLQGLQGIERPWLLDVATGTGRLPLNLLREQFSGQIIGLDLSRGMLAQARAKLLPYGNQVKLIRQDASRLPFADNIFDAVTCLESLEFMPRPLDVLDEMVRVLAPGGVLFFTNRVGWEARLLPGKAVSRARFKQVLAALPLRDVRVRLWQVDYDLVLAYKREG